MLNTYAHKIVFDTIRCCCNLEVHPEPGEILCVLLFSCIHLTTYIRCTSPLRQQQVDTKLHTRFYFRRSTQCEAVSFTLFKLVRQKWMCVVLVWSSLGLAHIVFQLLITSTPCLPPLLHIYILDVRYSPRHNRKTEQKQKEGVKIEYHVIPRSKDASSLLPPSSPVKQYISLYINRTTAQAEVR